MSVSVDWKPKRAVQAKLETKVTIILIGWNPKGEIYAKIKDQWQNNCISQAQSTWGIRISEDPQIRSIYNSKTHNRGNMHQSSTIHLGHPDIRRPPNSKHLQFKNSQQGKYASVKQDPFGASNYQKTSSFEASTTQRLEIGAIQSC